MHPFYCEMRCIKLKKIVKWLLWLILLYVAVKSGSWVAIVAVIGTFIAGCILKSLVPLVIAIAVIAVLYVTGALGAIASLI